MSARTITFSAIKKYIEINLTAVVSTFNDDGALYGAAVYTASNNRLFFITKKLYPEIHKAAKILLQNLTRKAEGLWGLKKNTTS